MKRNLILAVFAVASITTGAFAQKINAAKLPAAVKEAFAKAYPAATALHWDKEGKDYEASFKQEKESLSVVFDSKGQLLEVEKGIKASALPAAVQTALKGQKVKEAAVITKGGKTYYEAEVGGKDLIFDADGKAITKM